MTRGYLELLHGMHMKTMRLPLPLDAFPVKSSSLEKYLILKLEDFGKECYSDLIKKSTVLRLLKVKKKVAVLLNVSGELHGPFAKLGRYQF